MTTSETPRRVRMTRAERRLQLLDVAEQVFAEQGYAGTSMDDLADRAGVTKPVVYDHFGSKDNLLAAVVERISGELRSVIQAAAAESGGSEDAMAGGIRAYLAFVEERSAAWQVLLVDAAASRAAAEAVEVVRQASAQFIANILRQDLPAVDPRATDIWAQAMVAACERVAVVRLAGDSRSGPGSAGDSRSGPRSAGDGRSGPGGPDGSNDGSPDRTVDLDAATAWLMDLLWLGLSSVRAGRHWSAPRLDA